MTAAAGSAPIESTPVDPSSVESFPAPGPDPAGVGSTGRLEQARPADSPAPPEHTPGVLDWVLVVAITVLSAWAAVIGLAFLPLYVGSIPLPLSSLLGVAAMILAPRTCYRLTGSMLAALLPVLAWFGVSVWVVMSYNRLLPTVPLTVIAGQWRVMVMLGLGALAAAATVGLIWGDRLKDRVATERSVAGGTADRNSPSPAA